MDTVPPGELGSWESNPYELHVRGDRLVGLGAADMKAAIAAMLHAAAEIRAATSLRGTIVLAFTADEENGSLEGMHWLCRTGVIEADAAVMTEPASFGLGSWEGLYTAQRGSGIVRVTAHGIPGHSGEPLDPSRRAGTVFARALDALVDARLFEDLSHPVDGSRPTVNVATMVGGGDIPFAHPEALYAIVDVRTIEGMTEEQVLEELRAVVTRAGLERAVTIEPAPSVSWVPPGKIVTDSRLLDSAHAAWREIFGSEPCERVFPAGTDSSYVDALGIPALPAFGPGTLAVAHRPNESLSAADLPRAIDLFKSLFRNYLSDERVSR
jgi:acetylornithine deacetylase/succinyl-diaminopimelate desuccinylase-like protein